MTTTPSDFTAPEFVSEALDRRSNNSFNWDAPKKSSSGIGTLIALLSVIFFAQLLYLNIATLLPQFVEINHPTLNSLEVGIMFAAY